MNSRICSLCEKVVPYIFHREFIRADGWKRKEFVDEAGKKWRGSCCPTCGKIRADAYNRRHGGEYKGVQKRRAPLSTRICRVCAKPLGADRYFKHTHCDSTYRAYHSGGQSETIWTGEEYGGFCHSGVNC